MNTKVMTAHVPLPLAQKVDKLAAHKQTEPLLYAYLR